MKRTTGLGALIFAFGTAAAIAAPIDDATRKTAAADTQANSAVAKLTQIGKTISMRQDVLTRLLRTLDDARERQKRLGDVVIEVLKRTETEITTQTRELTTRRDDVRQAQQDLAAARERLGASRRALEAATANERKAFESTPEFIEANQAFQTKQQHLEQLRKDLETRAQADPAVSKAKEALAKAESEVAAHRAATSQDADALAAASAKWIETRNALALAMQAQFDRHPPYQESMNAMRAAQQSLSRLTAQFEASIVTLPGVADALLATREAASDVAACEAALKAADDAAERIVVSIERRKSELTLLRRVKVESDVQLEQVQDEIRRLQLDLRTINQQLADAIDDVTGIRAALRSVADALRAVDAEQKKKK